MRTLVGFAIAMLAATALVAQNRSGFVNTAPITRSFGSVVYPGGTSALPGVQRTTGSVVYPGGGSPTQIGVPAPVTSFGLRGSGTGFGRPPASGRRGGSAVYAYPVYVGGYYDGSYMTDPTTLMPQQPNVTVIMPPQQPPVIINLGAGQTQQLQPLGQYQLQTDQSQDMPQSQVPAAEPPHYLIAFQDHTIYSAIAYWVDGDTLHYFTTGNTHNQVSVSLIDRELTTRLNRELGVDVKLPAK